MPGLWYSVSATTRPRRPGEVDGVNYHFVTEEQFAELVDAGRLLEHAHFAGNHYGTPREPVEQRLAAGEDVLLEIEVQGARQVRAAPGLGAEAVLIFLAPPSFDELARRLVGRGTEDAATRQARLAAARDELAAEKRVRPHRGEHRRAVRGRRLGTVDGWVAPWFARALSGSPTVDGADGRSARPGGGASGPVRDRTSADARRAQSDEPGAIFP